MSSQEWRVLYQTIRRIDKTLPRPRRRPEYSDVLIVAMYCFAAAHDRPQSWACDPRHYRGTWCRRPLPSQSRFSRRIRSPRCQALLAALPAATRPVHVQRDVHHLDSRPLIVGGCSKDHQARRGWVHGNFGRGYRLHACTTRDGYFAAFRVTSLNTSEQATAPQLLEEVRPTGWVLGDANFDSAALYVCAARWGGQLLAPPRAGAGCGHRPQEPQRLRAIALWTEHGAWALRERKAIDRFFGQHSSYGGGLAPLPAWVRTANRVTRWVTAKVALYHVRRRLRVLQINAA